MLSPRREEEDRQLQEPLCSKKTPFISRMFFAQLQNLHKFGLRWIQNFGELELGAGGSGAFPFFARAFYVVLSWQYTHAPSVQSSPSECMAREGHRIINPSQPFTVSPSYLRILASQPQVCLCFPVCFFDWLVGWLMLFNHPNICSLQNANTNNKQKSVTE